VVSNGEKEPMSAEAAPVYRARLADLLEGSVQPRRDLEIQGLAMDSRQVSAGTAFLACPGRTTHGVAHAAEAVARGAVAVLW